MTFAAITNTIPGASDVSAQADNAVRHAKLTHAAQQFEAVMLGELMKPLGKNTAIGADEDESSSGSTLQSYGVEAMAGALAKSGALGFANRIVGSVEKHDTKISSEKSADGAKVPQERADNPRGGN